MDGAVTSDAADGPTDGTSIDAPPAELAGNYTYVKASNTGAGDNFGFSVALSEDGQTLAVGAPFEASNATGIEGNQVDNSLAEAGAVYVFVRSASGWSQQAYIKASNTGTGDRFGYSLALSSDGATLVVGAAFEASCATGVDGDQQNNSCGSMGAAYVFERANGHWSQQAYLKASNTPVMSGYTRSFGQTVAISADSSTIAVGGPGDSSAATGIDGDQSNTGAAVSGAVYVFTRSGASWAQQAYVKASNTGQQDVFGSSIALSTNGDVMAVGAPGEASAAKGVNGTQVDDSAREAGAVYLFKRTGSAWAQQAYVKASNTDAYDEFGCAVALSAIGTTLVVGARGESSGSPGVNGDQTDNSQLSAGAVYAFAQAGSSWAQQAYVKGAKAKNGDFFGFTVGVSSDGNTLIAGAPGETGGGTGLTTPQSTNAVGNSGASYMFRRAGSTWSSLYYLKASNTGSLDAFGDAVSESASSGVAAIAAPYEDSAAIGINGDQQSDAAASSGAVYVVE